MDPLSITASIIAVLQLTGTVVSVCYDFRSGIKNAPRDLERMTNEVISLRDVLERLVRLADSAETAGSNESSRLSMLKLLNKPDGPLVKCQAELEALKKKLAPAIGMKAIGKALSWPLKEGDVRKTLDSIGRFKATLSLALTADQTTLTLAILDDVTVLVHSVASVKLDEYRRRIHRWLSAPDPSSNHNAACKKRQPTTGSWFVKSGQYADWRAVSCSFLWLHGIPGCGKTILCSTIIEDVLRHCQSELAVGFAYFYFDFNDRAKQRQENLIRSLIMQLSMRSVEASKPLNRLYSRYQDRNNQPTFKELVAVLNAMIVDFRETYIILDGLDESSEREELLELIVEINGWMEGNIHMLATSRKERDIEEALSPLLTCQICIQSAQVNSDIQMHIRERLENDPKLKKWGSKLHKEIEETLMDRAHGMFRWVVCQLDALRKCLKVDMLRRALKSLPKTLDDTYDRILLSIDEEYSQDALKILKWMTFSARPVLIEELAEVVAVDLEINPRFDPERRFPEPWDVLVICSSLVTTSSAVVENQDGIPEEREEVRLAHFSVREYLITERIRNGPASKFSVPEMPAHLSIAQTCLLYLLQFNKPDSLTPNFFQEYPLARYAAKYWTQHAKMLDQETSETSVINLGVELFEPRTECLLNSIRIFDPDKRWVQSDFMKEVVDIAPALYYVSLSGLSSIARLLLERGADANEQGGRFGNALHAASIYAHEAVVQLLVENAADVEAKTNDGETALHGAAGYGHEAVARLLVAKGADVNAKDIWGRTPLHRAASNGHEASARLLLDKGAHVDGKENKWRATSLQLAAYNGHEAVVQLLLDNGANIDVKDNNGETALHWACGSGREAVARLLLDKDADISAKDDTWGETALDWATGYGYEAVVRLLMEKMGGVEARECRYGQTALHFTTADEDEAVARLLLDQEADIKAKGDKRGETTLHWAVRNGREIAARLLLDEGADIEAKDMRGETALHVAVRHGHMAAVRLLVDKGAKIEAKNMWGRTALHVAALSGHEEAARLLVEKEADINIKDRYGETVLFHAIEGGHEAVIRLLVEKGADVEAKDSYGETMLYWAAEQGHEEVVRLLQSKTQRN